MAEPLSPWDLYCAALSVGLRQQINKRIQEALCQVAERQGIGIMERADIRHVVERELAWMKWQDKH